MKEVNFDRQVNPSCRASTRIIPFTVVSAFRNHYRKYPTAAVLLAFSWLINGGDPIYLLGWPSGRDVPPASKFAGPKLGEERSNLFKP